jgi:hypothetical protein
MKLSSLQALVGAVVAVCLGIGAFLMGVGLVPSKADAITKGTYAPWLIVWGMVFITILCAGVVAAFLVSWAMKGGNRGRA